jgi:hypothetical protein
VIRQENGKALSRGFITRNQTFEQSDCTLTLGPVLEPERSGVGVFFSSEKTDEEESYPLRRGDNAVLPMAPFGAETFRRVGERVGPSMDTAALRSSRAPSRVTTELPSELRSSSSLSPLGLRERTSTEKTDLSMAASSLRPIVEKKPPPLDALGRRSIPFRGGDEV